MHDGIEAVLDEYDLKEGHDKFTFMERMVTDPTVTHVLVMCDQVYAEKADARTHGVGTESQIISSEVYGRVGQSKFIPIVCEWSEDGKPCLPTFLRSRMYVNFSSLEAVNENWEKLVRLLFGKPAHQKPQLGKPPAYITTDTALPSSPAIAKFSTFKQALLENRNGLSVYRRELLSSCVEYADSFRIREEPDQAFLGTRVLEDCRKLKAVRDQIVDWVLLESETAPTDEFCDALTDFLEELRELKARPSETGNWDESWSESRSVFVYETFLYIVASLLKAGAYNALHEVFTSHYLRPKSERNSQDKFDDFGSFYGCSEALQSVLAPQGKTLLSPTAELIKMQADRKDVPFSSVMEGELLVLLMALVSPDVSWYPPTLFYRSQSEFPFFIRATQHKHFLKLATITGIKDADALRDAVRAGQKRLGVNQWHHFTMRVHSFWESMNMDNLDSLK